MEHYKGIHIVHEDLFHEIEEEINRVYRINEKVSVICIDSLSPDQSCKLHDLLESGGIKLEPLVIEKWPDIPDIPDLSCMIDEYRHIRNHIPNKAKSVAKADGFNPPPMKGRKQRYHR